MKKSRITKLALSGAAVAALAATFSTSTYAWYVSNKTANVTAVAGSTASSGVGSSISLSLTGNVNDYHKTIALADKTSGLVPVVRTAATLSSAGAVTASYTILDETTDADGSSAGTQYGPKASFTATEGTHYYEYVFYLKADTGCNVRPTITVTNTTQTLPTQINYSGGYEKVAAAESAPAFAGTTYYSYSAGSYSVVNSQPEDWATTYTSYYVAKANAVTGANAGADFYVNALNAAHMSLGIQTGTAYDAAGSVTTFQGTTAVQEFAAPAGTAITNFLNPVDNSGKPTGASEATAGAHAYYAAIQGAELTTAATTLYTTGKTAFTTLTLEANTPYKLVYHLWLDGADDQCFNCCAGQTFSVSFDYTVTA